MKSQECEELDALFLLFSQKKDQIHTDQEKKELTDILGRIKELLQDLRV